MLVESITRVFVPTLSVSFVSASLVMFFALFEMSPVTVVVWFPPILLVWLPPTVLVMSPVALLEILPSSFISLEALTLPSLSYTVEEILPASCLVVLLLPSLLVTVFSVPVAV